MLIKNEMEVENRDSFRFNICETLNRSLSLTFDNSLDYDKSLIIMKKNICQNNAVKNEINFRKFNSRLPKLSAKIMINKIDFANEEYF